MILRETDFETFSTLRENFMTFRSFHILRLERLWKVKILTLIETRNFVVFVTLSENSLLEGEKRPLAYRPHYPTDILPLPDGCPLKGQSRIRDY